MDALTSDCTATGGGSLGGSGSASAGARGRDGDRHPRLPVRQARHGHRATKVAGRRRRGAAGPAHRRGERHPDLPGRLGRRNGLCRRRRRRGRGLGLGRHRRQHQPGAAQRHLLGPARLEGRHRVRRARGSRRRRPGRPGATGATGATGPAGAPGPWRTRCGRCRRCRRPGRRHHGQDLPRPPATDYDTAWDDVPTGGGSVTVEEADGTPSVSGVTKIKVGNGDLTDEGSGVVRVKRRQTPTGGGGGSSPADIPDLLTWFNAEDLAALSDGDTVSEWPNAAPGRPNEAGQGQGATPPVWKDAIINGLYPWCGSVGRAS